MNITETSNLSGEEYRIKKAELEYYEKGYGDAVKAANEGRAEERHIACMREYKDVKAYRTFIGKVCVIQTALIGIIAASLFSLICVFLIK